MSRRDVDPVRNAKFRDAAMATKKDLFVDKYGDKDFWLGLLVCHPDYQRRGAGKKLVTWGLDKARDEGLTITIFASPMGRLLYTHLGFREVDKFVVQVEGEEEILEVLAMAMDS
jgi:GNAT superfamily N-acetyltransferase